MAMKDYYLVLGVPRTESQRGIRKAFRDLAREHHPDRAGPAGTPVFREVVEAYRVLSDPEQRRSLDARLRQHESRDTPARSPLRATSRRRAAVFDPVELFREPSAIRPSADALFDRILRNFARTGPRKGEHREPLLCDVALTPTEAVHGGILPIRVPVRLPCSSCHGAGHYGGFRCGTCGAEGQVRAGVLVPLRVPPGVPSGAILEAPLDRSGIRNLWLRARIRVVD